MSAYSDFVLSKSPVAYWRLGESSGTSAVDATGNGRTGTYAGTYTLGNASIIPSSPADASVSLSGAGRVDVANNAAFDTSSAFSFIGRFKRASTSSYDAFFHRGDFAQNDHGVAVHAASGNNDVVIEYYNSGWRIATFSNVLPGTNEFSFAFIYLGGTSVKVVVNGTVTSTTLPIAFLNASQTLRLFARKNSVLEFYWDGVVDDCAWFNYALLDADAQDIHDVATICDTGIFSITSPSEITFRAGSLFGLSSKSSATFEQPYRAVSISGSSEFYSVTSLRNFVIVGNTSTLFRFGSRIGLSSSSTVDAHAHGLAASPYSVGSDTVTAFAGMATGKFSFVSLSKTKTSLRSGYNAMTRMVVTGRTKVSTSVKQHTYTTFAVGSEADCLFSSPEIVSRAFSFVGKTRLSITAHNFILSTFNISLATTFLPKTREFRESAFFVVGNSAFSANYNSIATAELSAYSTSVSAFRSRRIANATFFTLSGDSASFTGRAWNTAFYAIPAASLCDLNLETGPLVWKSSAFFTGRTLPDFASTFDASDVPQGPDCVVSVFTKEYQYFTRA